MCGSDSSLGLDASDSNGKIHTPGVYEDMTGRLLRVREASELLGLGRSHTYDLIARHELPYIRIGRSVRVPLDALEVYLAERLVVPAAQPTER